MQAGRAAAAVLLLATAGVLAGCARTPTPALYVLDARPTPALSGAASGIVVGLAPLELPQYLDRPQIVTRDGANRLDASQAHVWAEPLVASATRVLISSIGAALESDRVYRLPRRMRAPMDWRVDVEISHFDGMLGETAVLAARWELYPGGAEAPLLSRGTLVEQPLAGADYADLVAGLNTALERLGAEIAGAIAAAGRE
ncbi:MAG: PqiC family protein [Gammaproteobacteria bacterium]